MSAARPAAPPAAPPAALPAALPAAPLVEVTRRDVRDGRQVVESVHTGHLVVVADGNRVAALGDPDRVVFARSAVKPFQATACLELLADAGVALPTDAEVAVAWASHRGEPRHLAAVRALLARAGLTPDELTCAPGVSEADPGGAPSRLTHNCSGKHALFALAGKALTGEALAGEALTSGASTGTPAGVIDPDGPVQLAVLGLLAEVVGPVAAVGVDGCGAPAVAVPLAGLASGFARLAVESRWSRVREAGLAHPGLVGGEGRLETALLGAGVLAKVGAEGVYGVGWRTGDGRAWGLAVKAADGGVRGAAEATIALLAAWGVVPAGAWTSPPPLGGGHPAGTLRPSPELAALLAAGPPPS